MSVPAAEGEDAVSIHFEAGGDSAFASLMDTLAPEEADRKLDRQLRLMELLKQELEVRHLLLRQELHHRELLTLQLQEMLEIRTFRELPQPVPQSEQSLVQELLGSEQ